MAVKQNNTEGNSSSADANQNNKVNGVKSTGTITKSKNMNSNGTNNENGGVSLTTGISLGSGANVELPGCSGNAESSNNKFIMSSSINIGAGSSNASAPCTISAILNIIEIIKQQQVDLSNDIIPIHQNLIISLARVKYPVHNADDLKRFKDDIAKVGSFLSKTFANNHLVQYSCLNFVCQIMTRTDIEAPSCALAVIFHLFNKKMIVESVQWYLDHDVPDQNILRIVRLLCDWLKSCNFCKNLNIWIITMLNGLRDRNKILLVEQIALDNISQLFPLVDMPALRQKVAPVILHMLSSNDQNPEVFHKILSNFPRVIKLLENHSNSTEEYEPYARKMLQDLVDLANQLIVRFDRDNHNYAPIEEALKGYQSSNNFFNYSSKSFETSIRSANAKVGLVNLGNTCYMNSVLQALAMTKEFSREILLTETKSPLLIKMQQQIALMLYSTRHELTPTKLLNATRPPGFSPGLQQDSSEFLGYLLETLHEQEVAFRKNSNLQNFTGKHVTNKIMNQVENTQETGASALYNGEQDDEEESGNITDKSNISIKDADESNESTNLQAIKKNALSLSTIPSQQTSTIEKTFTGKLATTYKCLTCGLKSCNIDSFRDLQLSFPDVKNDCASNYSVQDLIEYYCSSEKLYGDNQYFCERCKKLSDAERYMNVISAPKNLILTLKHFKYDQKYHMRAKLMHKVFHEEKISLKVCAPESLEEISTVHYDLYAGVVHSGFSMDSGHYYTYAADASNKWYKFNDTIVTPSKTEELHNLTPPNTPYIMFYQMGSRSNETPETSASTKVIKVDVPTPLTLEELPQELREMVAHDNYVFTTELKLRRYKNANSFNAITKDQRRDSFEDDDDDQPPPAGGCGGNTLNINVNRFVY